MTEPIGTSGVSEPELTVRRFTGWVNLSRHSCPSCGRDAWLDPHGEPVQHADPAHDTPCPALIERRRMQAVVEASVAEYQQAMKTAPPDHWMRPSVAANSADAASLRDNLKAMFDRYLADDQMFLRPDPPPVLTPHSKMLLDRMRSFREDLVGDLFEDDALGIQAHIGDVAREQANRIRGRLDAALLSLPADHRLCVHGFGAGIDPSDLDGDVYRFAVREHWHRLGPGEECGGSRAVYSHPAP